MGSCYGFYRKTLFLLSFCLASNSFSASLFAQTTSIADSLKSIELFQIIRSGDVAALEKKIKEGANVNATLNSCSALMSVTLNGSAEQMKLLIDHGANVNYADKDSLTALWYAIPDWDKTVLLIDHGADIQMRSKEGYTVLAKLVNFPGTAKLLQLFIDRGLDPKKCAPDNTLVYEAASSCDTAVLGTLFRSGLKANDTVAFGDYPINSALSFRCYDLVKMLVENGANVNVNPSGFRLNAFNGVTPLMYAAWTNNKRAFLYLLEKGADPNAKSTMGYTPLMFLQQADTDDPEMTLALIKHGANVHTKAPDGSDALYFAEKRGNSESVAILKQHINN